MAVNEIGKLISSKTPPMLFENICFSNHNKNNLIILPDKMKAHNKSLYSTLSFWNNLTKKLDMPSPHNMVASMLKYKLKRYLYTTQQSGNSNHRETYNFQ